MVAQFLQLKLRLLGNQFKRSVWQVVALILALVYGLGAALVVFSILVGLRFADVDLARSIVTVGGGALVLGFIVLPLVFGVDDVLDPRRFSLFGISTSRLANGLALAALVSVPSLVIAIIAFAQIITWSRGALSVVLAILAFPIIVATCVLCARVATAVASFLLATRRARDTSGVIGIAIVVGLVPVFLLLLHVDWPRDGVHVLSGVSSVVGWTPLGAAWSAPADAAAGHAGEAWLKALIAAATVGVLWFGWRALISAMQITPGRSAEAKVYRGLGWFSLLPASRTGTVAARSLTYWARDARYHVSLVVIPIIPFIMIVVLMIAGVPGNALALLPVPVVALFLGWSVHNDVAYDNTALWLHLVSDIPGRADRFGRLVPPLLIGVPVIVIAAFVCAPIFGDQSTVPSIIGVGLCLLLAGLGLSSVMSARFPYPAVRPGDSPFAQPQSGGAASSVIQSLSFAATILVSLPTFALAGLGIAFHGAWPWLALLAGLATGCLLLWAGVAWGGRIFMRRTPELLAFSVRN